MSQTRQDRSRQHKPPSLLEIQLPTSERPQTFLQRLSFIMPNLPHRKSTPNDRPKSAPPVSVLRSGRCSRGALHHGMDEYSRPLFPPSLNIPTLSEPAEVCCYDCNTYYSFPNIDEPASGFLCGLMSPNSGRSRSRESAARKLAEVRPCQACRRGSVCSHITVASVMSRPGSKPVSTRRVSGARNPIPRPTSPVARVLDEGFLGPRPYTATSSSARVTFQDETGRGRGRVRLPVLPPLNTILSAHSNFPSPSTPTTPKLHHIHGLPRSREYPYVHKHELAQHLTAQAAGAPSSFIPPRTTSSSRSRSQSTSTSPPPVDFSKTIYYPRGVSPTPRRPQPGVMPGSNPPTHVRRRNLGSDDRAYSRLAPIQLNPLPKSIMSISPSDNQSRSQLFQSPHNLATFIPPPSDPKLPNLTNISPSFPAISELEIIQAVSTVGIENSGRPTSVDLELKTTRVYSRAHSPAPNSIDEGNDADEESSFSTGTMPRTPSIVGGRRLELRGGTPDQVPRLRGGNDISRKCRWNRFKSDSSILWCLKKRILTCHDPYDTSKGEALPAPRRARKILVRKRLVRDRVASLSDSAELGIRTENGASDEVVNAER
jgi:hypothetical protein